MWICRRAKLQRRIRPHPLHDGRGGDPDREPHLGCVTQGDASANGGAGLRPRDVPRRHWLAWHRRQVVGVPGPVPPPPAP
ncbi:hypothetical protein PHJA_000558200 [Phtheirospermum japonicum]|uniref:Uncharacterized protein n=1 Tax=Phtheirospermum japonicum TaxID=374723 RepID=A0A830BJL8_9LAMI|nr:hypothetical protein PHJA_000558200 [Phtheirospermum japonicum]